MHELPLVVFTVFGQACVGLMLLALISHQFGMINSKQLKLANIVGLSLIVVGLVVGMLHVGKPLRAINMLMGLGRSPMSMEILLSSLFFASTAATVLFSTWQNKPQLAKICNIIAVILGIAFAWSITRVYQLNTVPNWNTLDTSLQMWLTVLVAGGGLAMFVGAHKLGTLSLLVGTLLTMLNKPSYLVSLGQLSPELSANQTTLWGVQLVMLTLAIFVSAAMLLKGNVPRVTLAISAGVIIIGELAGRIAFYNLWQVAM